MRYAAILCAVVLAGVCSRARPGWADDWNPTGKPKVLINAEGMVATMVTLKPKGNQGRVALLVEGTQTALDGVVRLLVINEQGRGADFVRVDANGKEYVALATRQGWSSTRDFVLSVPGRNGVRVYWDPKRSDRADATKIVNRLLLRRAAATAGRRGELEKQASEAVGQAARSANATCGSSVKVEVQHKSFNDAALKVLDVGAACGAVLRAVAAMCDDDPGKDAIKRQVKSVTCKLGAKLAIDLRGGKLDFTTAVDTPGQDEWARDVLLKKL